MTSDDDKRPASRRQRQQRQDATPADSATPSADQGDLWAETEPEAPVDDDLDDFISDLPSADEWPTASAGPSVTPSPVQPSPPAPDDYEAYSEAEYSMLRNPFVLAALAVAGAIILAVVFVLVFSEGANAPRNVGGISRTPTPLSGETPGTQAEVIAKAAIREGPGLEFFELGLLNNGQKVSVVGRNEDSSWYQIVFAGTDLKGWVPDSALRLPDDSDGLIEVVLFTPIPKPSVEQPTATPLATPIEEALGPPDISVEVLGNVCPASGPIDIALRNVGAVDISGRQVVVTVSTQEGVVSEQTLVVNNLDIGDIVPVNTGIEVQPPRTTVAVVFVNEPQDTDPSNNVVTCVVAGEGEGGPSSTAVPPPIQTPDN